MYNKDRDVVPLTEIRRTNVEGFQKTLKALNEKWLLPASALNFQRKRTDLGDATPQESNEMDSRSLHHSYRKASDVGCGLLIQLYYSNKIQSASSMRQE